MRIPLLLILGVARLLAVETASSLSPEARALREDPSETHAQSYLASSRNRIEDVRAAANLMSRMAAERGVIGIPAPAPETQQERLERELMSVRCELAAWRLVTWLGNEQVAPPAIAPQAMHMIEALSSAVRKEGSAVVPLRTVPSTEGQVVLLASHGGVVRAYLVTFQLGEVSGLAERDPDDVFVHPPVP